MLCRDLHCHRRAEGEPAAKTPRVGAAAAAGRGEARSLTEIDVWLTSHGRSEDSLHAVISTRTHEATVHNHPLHVHSILSAFALFLHTYIYIAAHCWAYIDPYTPFFSLTSIFFYFSSFDLRCEEKV